MNRDINIKQTRINCFRQSKVDGEFMLQMRVPGGFVDAKYLKSAATCVSAAEYYKSCEICEIASATEIFTNGSVDAKNHVGGTYLVNSKEADCQNKGYTGDQTYSEPISINPFEEVVVNYDEGEVRELYQLVLELRNHRHHRQSRPLSAVDVIPHDNNRNIITLLNRLCGSTIGQRVGQDYKSFKANKIKLVRLLLQLNKCENLVAAIEQANKTVIIL